MAAVPRLADIPRRLSPDAFWDLFGRLEHAELDFKRGVPADVRDTVAAMAMTRGGLIVHGVDDLSGPARYRPPPGGSPRAGDGSSAQKPLLVG